MAARSKPPSPMVEKSVRGLVPVGPFDAEEIDRAKPGQIYDLVPRTKRSLPQMRLYWLVLGKIVEATGAWPTSSHLHDLTMKECGFVTTVLNPFTGEWEVERDSFALDRMTKDEADIYVTSAFDKLSAALGFDVLELLPKKAAA